MNIPMEIFRNPSIKSFDLRSFQHMYQLNEKEYDFTTLTNIDGILLEYLHVEEEFRGVGFGSAFISELKNQNKPIILYSPLEVTSFWKKNGFVKLFSHVYIWESK